MEISVTLLPDSEAPERESKALIEHAVQDSWVSKKLVDKINLELEERDENVVPPIWNGCELVPVGLIALDFRRNDVEKPRVFEGTFQVADDDRFAILLGEELLNEEPEIENPKRSIFLNLRKKETQEEKEAAESRKREQEEKKRELEALKEEEKKEKERRERR